MQEVSLDVFQSPYKVLATHYLLYLIKNTDTATESCALKHSQMFFLEIVRDIKYFSNVL